MVFGMSSLLVSLRLLRPLDFADLFLKRRQRHAFDILIHFYENFKFWLTLKVFDHLFCFLFQLVSDLLFLLGVLTWVVTLFWTSLLNLVFVFDCVLLMMSTLSSRHILFAVIENRSIDMQRVNPALFVVYFEILVLDNKLIQQVLLIEDELACWVVLHEPLTEKW